MTAEPERGPDLERLARRGVTLLGARGVAIGALSVVANLVLARLLTPRDFGLVALGTTLVLVGTTLGGGGLASALIARARPPARDELRALLALQFAVAGGFAAVGVAIALVAGGEARIPAVMLFALPLLALRTPAVVVLERDLAYAPVARAEVLESLTGYAWAIAGAAVGWGAWALATAAPVRALAGTAFLARAAPAGALTPRWSWRAARPLLGLGARVQAVSVVAVARDLALNFGIAAVGGVATLGVWSLVTRVMQAPTLVFSSFSRVAFPALARLRDQGGDVAGAIGRGLSSSAWVVGFVAVAIAGVAPGVLPLILGDRWNDVAEPLALAALGAIVGTPITIVAAGQLFADNRAGVILRVTVIQSVCTVAVSLVLLPPLGVAGAGVGAVAGAGVALVLQARALHGVAGVRPLRSLALPTALAAVAGGAAYLLAAVTDGAVAACLAPLLGLALLAAGVQAARQAPASGQ